MSNPYIYNIAVPAPLASTFEYSSDRLLEHGLRVEVAFAGVLVIANAVPIPIAPPSSSLQCLCFRVVRCRSGQLPASWQASPCPTQRRNLQQRGSSGGGVLAFPFLLDRKAVRSNL